MKCFYFDLGLFVGFYKGTPESTGRYWYNAQSWYGQLEFEISFANFTINKAKWEPPKELRCPKRWT